MDSKNIKNELLKCLQIVVTDNFAIKLGNYLQNIITTILVICHYIKCL